MQKPHLFLAVLFGMMLLLNSVILTIPSCSAADVYWSDDFGDGSYYPEWNVTIGGFAAGVGVLRSTSSAGFPHQAIIYHASTASYGSWIFDLLYTSSGTKVMVAFMHNVKATSVFGAGIEGYTIELNGTHITLFRSTDIVLTPLNTANYVPADGMLDIEIIRVTNGTFYVHAEGLLYLTALDTTYTTSTYFTLGSAPHGYGIDNIFVSGTDGITPPPVIPGFPTIAIITGVLTALAITLFRRRRTPN